MMADLLQCLRTFCRVVERGSVSRAAVDLDLAQATVSRHLQDVEARYGTKLISRTTRSLQVTRAGQQIYEFALALIRSEAELAERLRESASSLKGHITIAAPSGLGHAVLNQFLVEYGLRHRELQLRLLLSEDWLNLIEEGVDIAFRIGVLADSSLYAKKLGTMAEVLVCSPGLFGRSRRIQRPDDLQGAPRIGLSRTHSSGITLSKGSHRAVLDAPLAFEVNSSLALREALLANRGYGAIHAYLVADCIRDGRLELLLPDWKLPEWPIHAMFSSKVRPFRVDHLLAEVTGHLKQRGVFI